MIDLNNYEEITKDEFELLDYFEGIEIYDRYKVKSYYFKKKTKKEKKNG